MTTDADAPHRMWSSAKKRRLGATVVFVGLVVAAVGSLGAPLITSVAEQYGVSLAAAQWTLTIALLSGAVATPVVSRLGSGPRRRESVVGTLAVVVVGSCLTVVPGPFALLLVGRGAQGVGLGLPALMMATARDHLDSRHATRTIALLSVASTAGIGVGYPLAGLLTDMSGIRAAYGLGLVVTAAALLSAVLVLPSERARPAVSVDLRGATVLALGLLILLTVISQTTLWHRSAAFAVTALVISLAVLSAWAVLELRTANPVVDVRLLRHPAVAAANAAMLVGGVGMYLLLSLITRFVQTPSTAGYGFGLSTFEAGLVLVPFSIMGFVAGKLVPLLRGRVGARRVLAVSTVAILVAFVLFVSARQQLLGAVLAMAVLGAGVGAFSAAMPSVILSVTPEAETASAMGVNQVVRSIGFSIGSAVGGLVLAAHTSGTFPRPSGYTSAAWVGMATTAASLLAIACLSGARSRTVG